MAKFVSDRRNRKGRNRKRVQDIFLLRLFYCGRRSRKLMRQPQAAATGPHQSESRRHRSAFIRPEDIVAFHFVFLPKFFEFF